MVSMVAGIKKKRTLGAKSASGAYQAIINLIPPHTIYREPFLGSGAVMKKKAPAAQNFGIDKDADAINDFEFDGNFTGIIGDGISHLQQLKATKDTVVYCDPPYVHSTRTSRSRYKYELTDDQHVQLLDAIKKLECYVLISGYRCELYDTHLATWRRVDFQVMSRGGVRTESVWFNFDPGTVHYHTFAGKDFTDRQRIKRKAERWAANFKALPPAERQAVMSALLCVDFSDEEQPGDDLPAATMETVEPARPVRHENATAPEHVRFTGATEAELEDIVQQFNAFMLPLQSGEHPDTNVFAQPAKHERVRLQKKADAFVEQQGWLTTNEAGEIIDQWREHALRQYDTRANAGKVVLSFFDKSGQWSQPWEDAGYEVYRFDIQTDPVTGDVNAFSVDFFDTLFGMFDGKEIYAILSANPCTDFAVSGARHFAAKDKDGRTIASVRLVHQTLRAVELFRPAVWGLENPVGRIERLGGLPNWRLSFDPNHLGDPYTKKTLIWGRFNADLPIAPVFPSEGSKMHTQYGGRSLATKNARSVTPPGFAYSFFMANNAIDNPGMALANKYDRLNSALIGQALQEGISSAEIENEIMDHYFFDQDDDAAEQALTELLQHRQKRLLSTAV